MPAGLAVGALGLLSLLAAHGQDFARLSVRFQVLEEAAPGTVLGSLPERCGWSAGDWAGGDFRLLRPPGRFPLRVGARDGLLSTAGRLDREQLCPRREPCTLAFSLWSAGRRALVRVEVRVLDLNDHAPRFPRESQELEVAAGVALHTRIPLERARDLDAGPNALCAYALSASEHFALEAGPGPEGAPRLELVVVKEVGPEPPSWPALVLTAVDHGVPPRSGTAALAVRVLDSPAGPPAFARRSLTVTISEDALPGALVAALGATDLGAETEFSFGTGASAEVLRTFVVESGTGRVLLRRPLDYEEIAAYEVEVQARSRGAAAAPARCRLYVQVLDANDHTPGLQVMWAGQEAVLREGQPHRFAALVTASDPDSGANGQVDCYLGQGSEHFALQRMDSRSYLLLAKAPLDRERRAELGLTLRAQDRGRPPRSAARHFRVAVADVNDNAPCFEADAYHVSVAENTAPPSVLVAVKARDADAGRNGEVVYRIPDPSLAEWLAIDARSGEIRAQVAFDAEKVAAFDFVVTAEDGGEPRLSSSVRVAVTVLDVNDNPPVVTQPRLEGGWASVTALVDPATGRLLAPKEEGGAEPVSSAGHPLLFAVSARDADSGANGALVYGIRSGNEAGTFVIGPQSGQVRLNGSEAGRLVGSAWELELSVSDQGEVPLRTGFWVRVAFARHSEALPESLPVSRPLGPSAVLGICLVGLLAVALGSLGLVISLCRKEKQGGLVYNCREAEFAYSPQPRKPPQPIRKADIRVVPVIWQEAAERPPEAPTDSAWADGSGAACQLTPTLRRTLRAWQGQGRLALLPGLPQRPFGHPRARSHAAPDGRPAGHQPPAPPWSPPGLLPPVADPPSPQATARDAPSCRTILRSLVRLSLAALAEQGPGGQLARDLEPVQQISQLLSLLHQGQVQPMTSHRGNKYAAKPAGCRDPSPDGQGALLRDGSGNGEHRDWKLLGEKLDGLLDYPAGLDLGGLPVEDPSWVARLSLPLSTHYQDNVAPPEAPPFPAWPVAAGREEAHAFATFGKAAVCVQSAPEPALAPSTLLYEMNTLFEMILAQKSPSHA